MTVVRTTPRGRTVEDPRVFTQAEREDGFTHQPHCVFCMKPLRVGQRIVDLISPSLTHRLAEDSPECGIAMALEASADGGTVMFLAHEACQDEDLPL